MSKDYLDFFDNRAFSDNNPCGPCYCTGPSMDDTTEKEMVAKFKNNVKIVVREYAVRLLKDNRIHGYLAYDENRSIAWCNAGNMDRYIRWIPEYARRNACGKTISVVCFAIAPEYRGKGIALAFLETIEKEAKSEGYDAIEGYAKERHERVYYDYTGPLLSG